MRRIERVWRRAGVVLGILVSIGISSASPALAVAGPHASCMGHEASVVSPPGTSDEIPGGMPELKQEISEAFPGIPPGAIYSFIAKIHAGSHETCDELIG